MTMPKLTAAVLAAAIALAGCGGGGGSKAPSTLSLHGDKIPVATLMSGLKGMCTVTHQALNASAAKQSYFSGPYNSLHQLAGILSGSRRSQLLSAMEAFERDVLAATPDSSAVVKDANALLALVDGDLVSLKLSKVAC
jgi:hypothetical protein